MPPIRWDGNSTPIDLLAAGQFSPDQIADEQRRILGGRPTPISEPAGGGGGSWGEPTDWRLAYGAPPASSFGGPIQQPVAPDQTMRLGTAPISAASPISPAPRPESQPLAFQQIDQLLSRIGPAPTFRYADLAGPQASAYNARASAATQALGEVFRNQLGEGELGLRMQTQHGMNGIPGMIANNAQAAAATHSPAGLEAQRRQQIIMALTQQGVSQQEINDTLAGLPPMSGAGGLIPNFLGAPAPSPASPIAPAMPRGDSFGPTGQIIRDNGPALPLAPAAVQLATTTPSVAPIQQRINSVMDRAIQSFQGPPGPNGRRSPAAVTPYAGPNVEPINNAITNYFSEFSEPELSSNYQAIAQAAVHRFGQTAMDGWQSRRFFGAGGTHGSQRDRVVRMQGGTPQLGTGRQILQNADDIISSPYRLGARAISSIFGN